MMLPEFVTSAMSPHVVEEEVWNEDSEDEVDGSGSSNEEGVEVDANENGKEGKENCEDTVDEPKVGMTFDTFEEVYLSYSRYAKQKGFAIVKRTSRKGADGKLKDATLSCSRAGKAKVRTTNPVRPRPQSRIGCLAHVTVVILSDGKWGFSRVVLEHNHERSPGKARFFKSNRVLDERVKKKLEVNDLAGIKLHQSYDSFRIEAGGPNEVVYLQRDCRNYLDKLRRLRLQEGDAEAMYSYFLRMQADNSDFFFAMDLNGKGRLRNVFWADARSRATCKEFGDVVTFDAIYLVNKYNMPFAPFVGVNHHGKSILLGCGLISHEDTESFVWLFKTWKACMSGRAPNALLTDQCLAMKNAIGIFFPDTRHRWCIWHIMKKVPKKLKGREKYESIGWCLRHAVYESLSIQEFEDSWKEFITKYELQSNTWLHGLYMERNRWVRAYLKDVFLAGMSSTQRSEGMNAYFDGYIHSKTTLKQLVEQYENALTNKVGSEKLDDMRSWSTYIPCIDDDDELEKQFQSVYTHAKVKEFQTELAEKMRCHSYKKEEGQIVSKYEVKQWVTFGEADNRTRKQVPYTVDFNVETNEAHCNCGLFETRGMVCRHQLIVYDEKGIEKVPDKYVFKRWCKNVKRVHTKVRMNYDKSAKTIEAQRHDNIIKLYDDVADLAKISQEKYELVMKRGHELKQELIDASVVCENNMAHDTLVNSFSIGNGDLPSKESMNILDPENQRRKGRPPTKKKQSCVEKAVKKKRETIKKTLSNGKTKEVDEIAVGHVFGTQESVANVNSYRSSYMGPPMWPNMMAHNMRPNMIQGGSIFPYSPSLGPNASTFNQLVNYFPSSLGNVQSLLDSQVWRGQPSSMPSQGQPSSMPSQVWGGQPSFMPSQGQPSSMPSQVRVGQSSSCQGQGWRGQSSFLE